MRGVCDMEQHIKYSNINYKKKNIEMIDYVRDFVSGKVETLRKIKPVGAMINTCLIQLFDSKGNPVKESMSHNIVNEFSNRQAFACFFYDLIRRSGIVLSYRNPFTNLMLTDYDGNENANELGLRGNLIGWANKNTAYSGSDTLRGTINLSESQTSNDNRTGLITLVFDFPTHAANGTINSVWWMYGGSSDYRYHGYPYWAYTNSSMTTNYDWACDGDYIYAANNSNIARYNMDTSTGVPVDVSNIDTNIRGIEFDGVYFWLYDATSKKVYKCNTAFQVQAQFTASAVTGTFTSLTVHSDKIFIATTTSLYIYNVTGDLQTTKSSADYGLATISRVKANNAYCHITGDNKGRYAGFLAPNGDLIFKINVSGESSWSAYCFLRKPEYNNSRLIIARVSIDCNHYIIGGIGAHTKLAAPVVKTAANTMKVTYTFDIDLPDALT